MARDRLRPELSILSPDTARLPMAGMGLCIGGNGRIRTGDLLGGGALRDQPHRPSFVPAALPLALQSHSCRSLPAVTIARSGY